MANGIGIYHISLKKKIVLEGVLEGGGGERVFHNFFK